VVGQTQLLFFSALAFSLLILSGIYPAEMRCVNLDADWVYRKGGRIFYRIMDRGLNGINAFFDRIFVRSLPVRLGEWSKVPLSSLAILYMRAKGVEDLDIQNFRERTRPETANLIPMGIVVFISLLSLFFLSVLFSYLV
jgi:multicomponent Na+:H+ antiporter subunit D